MTSPLLNAGSCVPRDSRDASVPSCETWCMPAHCRRWCKCASCGFCAAAAAASSSGDCSALGREERTRLQGRWAPTTGRSSNATCGVARVGYSPGTACGLRAVSPSSLHGRLMFVGDSVSRYHFMSLVAAIGRSRRPLTCVAVAQPTLDNRSALRGRAEFVELMGRDAYGGAPLDCRGPRLLLSYRRLNLLPPPELATPALRRFYEVLFAPLALTLARTLALTPTLCLDPTLSLTPILTTGNILITDHWALTLTPTKALFAPLGRSGVALLSVSGHMHSAAGPGP